MPEPTPPSTPLLSVRDLHVHFPIRTGLLQRTTGWVRAVDGISFELSKGETLGLVGESGCGKTTAGRALLRLIPPTSGTILFDGQDTIHAFGPRQKALRRQMQIIFQDPGGSLNPRMTVGDIVAEPLQVHGPLEAGRLSAKQLRAEVGQILTQCGMPASSGSRYPHEFSGGQRQRIAIARALALRPRLLVCDEPTSALDVSVQAQILNLLADLQKELGLSYLFISHDMAVINQMCDRIAVMYAGKIVEAGAREQIINRPQHAYTQTLLSAVPEPNPRRRHGPILTGNL